jgi:hypothetical protein
MCRGRRARIRIHRHIGVEDAPISEITVFVKLSSNEGALFTP